MEQALRLGLGTSGNDDAAECAETVKTALELGYRHVDTAQMYDNEAAVGDGVARADVPRKDVFLATKIHPDNLAYDDVIESAAASLDRLGVDSVDLLYVHWPTGAYDPEETLPAFDELYADGKTRHVGVSNFTTDLLDEARDVLDAPVFANQVELHPYLQQHALRAYGREHNIPLVAYAPLGRRELLDDPIIGSVAEKHAVSPARVILAWHLSLDTVAPIPKATSDAHLRDNYAAHDLSLDAEDYERLLELDRGERFFDPDDAPWR
ncbi:aldo/keto reductase [Halocalculus aciditolerans]|uniref:Aldehyde oxidoreductase n=1 Tax=Halocalculus aciditolerans TaxID=1383812 RepID=A0A830FH25_9EURY|nr:aldo/keto reductase [Halocalculus aciditolerans]GGL54539.1 aldehyde oxidoreductase [Halocalculus aciditolerans]